MPNDSDKILKKYRKRLEGHIDKETIGSLTSPSTDEFSKQYITFKKEILSKQRSKYETWCNKSEKIIAFDPGKIKPQLEEAIRISHLGITPTGAASFAALVGLASILFALFLGLTLFLITRQIKLFLPLIFLIGGIAALKILTKYPIIIASRWRLKASNQMVLAVLYVVMYMRHTSNLENAIRFAAQHISAPLSLDLRKIFWDIETRKYSTIKESLDAYLETWRHHNLEFITSFHLIESSLYEPTESRRIQLLDKGLDVMLEGTYEKMMHYAQDLKNPITMIHMLGVVLPILGLVIFPLVGSFLGGLIQWYHLALVYNIFLPITVFYFGMSYLSKRPTGYGEVPTSEKYKPKINPFYTAFTIAAFFIILGLSPVIIHFIDPTADISLGGPFGNFFDYVESQVQGQYFGPFGIGALLLSFFIPFGFAIGMSYYYKKKTFNLMSLRRETKDLEKEFASSLFQLGNRIADGIPAEIAFGRVAETMAGTPTGKFFKIVHNNLTQLGLSLKDSIFNPKTGALQAYPSPLIVSSMEVLTESAKKGPKVVSQSLISISEYIERINKVNERLKDLLAEIVSSMKSQISFMTPAIAGIVVGISAMIVNIIVTLNTRFQEFGAFGGADALGGSDQLAIISQIFNIEGVIPGFFFQMVVGVYVVQIVYVLTVLQNGIENGTDKISEEYLLGKNLFRTTILYLAIAVIVTFLFTALSQGILAGTQF